MCGMLQSALKSSFLSGPREPLRTHPTPITAAPLVETVSIADLLESRSTTTHQEGQRSGFFGTAHNSRVKRPPESSATDLRVSLADDLKRIRSTHKPLDVRSAHTSPPTTTSDLHKCTLRELLRRKAATNAEPPGVKDEDDDDMFGLERQGPSPTTTHDETRQRNLVRVIDDNVRHLEAFLTTMHCSPEHIQLQCDNRRIQLQGVGHR